MRRRGRPGPYGFALLGSLLLFSGCHSSNPAAGRLTNLEPGTFATAAIPDSSLADFLEEPEAASRGFLTLDRVVDLALRNNPEVRLAWLRARNQEARLGKAGADFYPKLTLSAGAKGEDQGISDGLEDYEEAYRQTSLDLLAEISYTLYDFGGSRKDKRTAAERSLDASLFRYNRKMQDVVLKAQRSYYNLHEGAAQIQAAKESLEEAQTATDAASKRYEAGTGTIQDTFQAQARLEKTRYDLEEKKIKLERDRADLAVLLGVPVSRELQVTEPLPLRIDPDIWDSVEELMAESMRQRADRLARLAAFESARASAEASSGQLWPRLALTGEGKLEGIDSTYLDSSGRLDNYTVGLKLQWDAFDGFRKRYEWLAARNKARQAAQQLREDELKISSEVWKSFYGLRSARAQLESARAREQSARKVYQAKQANYGVGTTDLLELLTAQKSLADARSDRISAEATFAESVAELLHAIAAPEALQPLVPDADRFSGTIIFVPEGAAGRVVPGAR